MELSRTHEGMYFTGISTGCLGSRRNISGIIKRVPVGGITAEVLSTTGGSVYVQCVLKKEIHEVAKIPLACIDIDEIRSDIKKDKRRKIVREVI